MKKLFLSLFIFGLLLNPTLLFAQDSSEETLIETLRQPSISDNVWGKIEEKNFNTAAYDFFIYNGKVYEPVTYSEIKGADVASFQINILSSYFGRDKNFVYFLSKKIEGADPKTFSPWSDFSNYGHDKNHVFFEDKKIAKADKESFEILDLHYSRDKNSIYYDSHRINGANLKTWTLADFGNSGYSKDKNSVYLHGKKVKGLDPNTFKVLIDFDDVIHYAKDKNGIYYDGKKIQGADAATFEMLLNLPHTIYPGIDYAQDENHVYYQGKMIPNADVATFETVDEGKMKDKNGTYIKGKKVDFFDVNKAGYVPVKLFFHLPGDELKDMAKLEPITRYIPKTPMVEQKTLELLFSGPTNQEIDKGYSTEVPFESNILSFQIQNGVATVDFGRAIEGGRYGVTSMFIREDQLRKTLLQFPTIKSVKISVAGQTENIFPAGE